MNQRLLATKFHTPNRRDSSVVRPRLLEQLTAGLQERRKLTLISAPAGYGKTTLAAQWLHSLIGAKQKVAWLSLDKADNDPTRFYSYWLAAFQQVDGSIGEKSQPQLDMHNLNPDLLLDELLSELLNDLAVVETPILLALEDYHLIDNPVLHKALEYFLEHQPVQVHLLLTTRTDPPLPLARLRAGGQMTEIRARDLRFTSDEARQFFSHAMQLDLADEAAKALQERTEGWAAGLQLAGLALQGQSAPAAFIETFRGSHRYVLDYLAEEVLRQQGEEVRAFLTQISVLERFNADSCCALTGRADAQALIAHLEQANLFMVPLDDERLWYRFHQLFSDYLRSLLTESDQSALNKKAAAWHEHNDMMAEAVRYALASGDVDFAAGTIERALKVNATWSGGNLAQLSSWLESLPSQAFQSRPQLSLNASRIQYLSGRFDLAEMHIAQTEQALAALPALPAVEREQLLALAALYRGAIASARGDVQQALEQTEFARARLPNENHLAHARAFFSMGLAYEIADQTGRAAENYLRSSDEARSAGVLFLAIHALCAAAQVQIKLGRLHQATYTCEAAIQLGDHARIAPLGLAWTILGGIALERNDLATAEELLQKGIAYSRRGGLMDDVLVGLAHLTRLRMVQDDTSAALAALHEVKSIMHSFGVQRIELLAAAHLARLQLYTGQIEAAAQWAAQYLSTRGEFSREFEDLTLARILLATGEVDRLPAILHPLLEQASAAGRLQTCMEAMMLLGLVQHAKKNTRSALEWLEKSLRIAAPEGFRRLYLDEGKSLLELLNKVRQCAPEFVDSLLSTSQPESGAGSSLLEQLPDPLSEQEMRVLKLIVAGKSNKEIAAELVISIGTAKWHVHNVLQKLGVSNRPQAIARARELGI